ncbi:hypothetical protein B0H14DRAFT_2567598 [Mycena olivaceomarginata]|nr:hypothetical protein B0H14DRAFT_2567598 [Mycena olivaceomarginata]
MGATIPDAMERYLVDQFELNNYKHISASIHTPELQLVISLFALQPLEPPNGPQNDVFDMSSTQFPTPLDGSNGCSANSLLKTWNKIDLTFSPRSEETSSDSFLSSSENRFIIFVTTLEDGDYLEERLGLPFYHADSDSHPISDEERRAIYGGWVAGKYIGFLASNSMGAGNDYWKVRFTIFYRNPFNFTLGEQQRGRAGRDGEPATNHFFCLKNGWKPSKKNDHPTYGDIPGRQALYYLIYKTDLQHPQSCYQYQIIGGGQFVVLSPSLSGRLQPLRDFRKHFSPSAPNPSTGP